MFGFFKQKEIDSKLLKTNITETVLNSWMSEQNLIYKKFDSFISFAEPSNIGGSKHAKFMTEKLRYITSIAVISLEKAGVNETLINEIISKIKGEALSMNIPELRGATIALGLKSKEYAKIRFSTNPREAGKKIENKFCQEAFDYIPPDSDTDRRYKLYKELSSFERNIIFDISTAIRKSKV